MKSYLNYLFWITFYRLLITALDYFKDLWQNKGLNKCYLFHFYFVEKCSDDDDCKHEGICKGDDGNKSCECTRFTMGDKCETINACLFGKYSHCKGNQGKCVFNKDKPAKAECVCPDGKKLYETIGYCAGKKALFSLLLSSFLFSG